MRIKIENLRINAHIGINDEERNDDQLVLLTVEFEFDERVAVETDRIGEAIDYSELSEKLIRAVQVSRFHLIEKLADHLLQLVMADQRIQNAWISVIKPNALRNAESVSASCSAQQKANK